MSEARYLSLVADPPLGFRHVTTLARRELRRWPFALYTRDFAAVEQRFGLLFDKLAGLIITSSTADVGSGGARLESRRLGPCLWAYCISDSLLPQLQSLVRPQLEMLETLRAAREEHRQVVTQLDRTRVDRARLAEYFAATQARSRIDIREHARWMVDALGALARLGAEAPNSSAVVDRALALLIREPFRYRGAALVELRAKRWRLLQDAGHRPCLDNLQPLTSATVQIGRLAQVPLPATRHGAPRALVVWRPDTAADFSMVEMSFFRLFAALLSTVPASTSGEQDED